MVQARDVFKIQAVKPAPVIYSIVNLSGAAAVYWHVVTGGWLTYRYQLSDPNIVNLVLEIIEPIAVLIVVAYWIWRTRALYRLLFVSFILQLVIANGFVAFFMFFFFTWTPKLM